MSNEVKRRRIIEENNKEIQEIEKIEENDQRTSNIFRVVCVAGSIILCGLKFVVSVRTLIFNTIGGEEVCENDVHFKITAIKNTFVVALLELLSSILFLWGLSIHKRFTVILRYADWKRMLAVCLTLTIIVSVSVNVLSGLWLFGLNTLFVVIVSYANYTMESVSSQVRGFLNEHRYLA